MKVYRVGWDCDVCRGHHVKETRWMHRVLWDQCPKSKVWFRLEDHEVPANG